MAQGRVRRQLAHVAAEADAHSTARAEPTPQGAVDASGVNNLTEESTIPVPS